MSDGESSKHVEKMKSASTDFVQKFGEWEKGRKGSLSEWRYLVGVDVGATNTRISFTFFNPSTGDEKFFDCAKVKCSCTSVLVRYVSIIRDEIVVKVFGGKCSEAAVVAVAGLVDSVALHAVITNYKGQKEISVEQLPAQLFPPSKTKFLNDLEACCFGILYLNSQDKIHNYFATTFSPSSEEAADISNTPIKLQNHHYLVVAMGTGLGSSLLFSLTSKQENIAMPKFDVIPLELGHCCITYPAQHEPDYQREMKRMDHLSQKVWGGQYVPEFEDVCSGRGLRECYSFETLGKELDPTEIAKQAQEENAQASRAFLTHYQYLMKAAQNVCIMIPSCKGIFFAGDNQVSNDPVVRSHVKQLHQTFLRHSKSAWLEAVVAFRQVKSFNLNIAGTFFYIRTHILQSSSS